MSDYLGRMEKELSKLDKKITKLNAFINAEDGNYESLSRLDQDLLIAQVNSMYAYSTILGLRLDLRHGK